jgi:calcineurin-like phosphoesterase family protein
MEMEEFKNIIKKRYKMEDCELSDRPEDLLNGTIILVLGNHDIKPKQYFNRNIEVIDGFYWKQKDILNKVYSPDPMFSGFIKTFGDKKCLFSHYEIHTNDEWDRKNKMIAPRIKVLETIFTANECNLNIHGHIHSNNSAFKYSKNVSFEKIGFKPVKLSTILV